MRDARINLRGTSAELEFIRPAAESSQKTLTEFVLASAAIAAERVFADRREFALINQQAGMTNVFVCEISGEIVAYYALSAGQVKHESAPTRLTKGVANHPIPVVILTRFAVDVRYQGMGLGQAMLRDLLIRLSQVAAEEIGIRALLIHAKDGDAKQGNTLIAATWSKVKPPLRAVHHRRE